MKKVFLGIMCGIGGFLISIIVLLIGVFIYFYCVPVKIDDVNKYLETDGFKSEFIVFPTNVENNDGLIEYHYYDYRLKDGSEIILSIKYDNTVFEQEIKRLDSLKYETVYNNINIIEKDENQKLFNYYTYVAVYEPEYKKFEYACIDFENKTIHYIRLDYINIDYISINQSLLPKFYLDNNEMLSNYSFNVYDDAIDNWLKN